MKRMLSIALVVLAAACDSTAPEDPERPEDELTFARFSGETDAEVAQASFYAVRGQTRTLTVRSKRIGCAFHGEVSPVPFASDGCQLCAWS